MIARLRNASWHIPLAGMLVAVTIALAAAFIAGNYGGPQLLYALLFGIAFNFLAEDSRVRPGIEFAARNVLRFGVALLGTGITLTQIIALGVTPITLVIVGVISTIAFGAWLGPRLKCSIAEGVLTGGAVAICGASAALAISTVLPKNEGSTQFTLLTVVGVTVLSTVAMIVYPIIALLLQLDANAAGIFIGGSIHDVAQVVAAGYTYSPESGATATFVKLLRVALLVPAVIVIGLLFGARAQGGTVRVTSILPGFLVGFIVLVGVNSLGLIPPAITNWLGGLSRWCLTTAIAALGMMTSIQGIAKLGWRPLILMVSETLLLGALVLGWLLITLLNRN
jgi:uncharacterized integral membrane protein (TIGR00698 family)